MNCENGLRNGPGPNDRESGNLKPKEGTNPNLMGYDSINTSKQASGFNLESGTVGDQSEDLSRSPSSAQSLNIIRPNQVGNGTSASKGSEGAGSGDGSKDEGVGG